MKPPVALCCTPQWHIAADAMRPPTVVFYSSAVKHGQYSVLGHCRLCCCGSACSRPEQEWKKKPSSNRPLSGQSHHMGSSIKKSTVDLLIACPRKPPRKSPLCHYKRTTQQCQTPILIFGPTSPCPPCLAALLNSKPRAPPARFGAPPGLLRWVLQQQTETEKVEKQPLSLRERERCHNQDHRSSLSGFCSTLPSSRYSANSPAARACLSFCCALRCLLHALVSSPSTSPSVP